jgi:hypothetical protein
MDARLVVQHVFGSANVPERRPRVSGTAWDLVVPVVPGRGPAVT